MAFKFIVLEGIDCSGKTTVSKLLGESLKPSTRITFPDRSTDIGHLLDKFLKKDLNLTPLAAHLLYSANRYEKAEYIKKTLETCNIICDRYWLSGAIYSTAKGLDFDWCKSIDRELPSPDYTFFIDVDTNVTSRRETFGSEAHDQVDFQSEVYRIYKEKAKEENLIIINGLQSSDKIVYDILEHLSNDINY